MKRRAFFANGLGIVAGFAAALCGKKLEAKPPAEIPVKQSQDLVITNTANTTNDNVSYILYADGTMGLGTQNPTMTWDIAKPGKGLRKINR